MKKIIVTGGCGFIGTNFIKNQLLKTKNKILNIDKLTYSANKDNLSEYSNSLNYRFIEGDICNTSLIRSSFKDFSPNIVINFAAETHVDRSIDSPDKFIETNILGVVNLLKVSLDYFNKNTNFKFIQVSTDEVYGSLNSKSEPFTESSPYFPNSPYSASKASSDHLVRAWFNTYNLPSIITNCTNNYGPYQFPEKLVPLTIVKCINEKTIPVYGNGLNIRDWLHVEDHCSALNTVIEKGKVGEKYIIGGNNEIKNIDVVTKICSLMDEFLPRRNKKSYKDLIEYVDDRPGHDFRYAVNSAKIQQELGWKQIQSFESGIINTTKWYLKNKEWLKNSSKNA